MIFKMVILLLILLILFSLGMGMFFLVNDQGKSGRARNALTVRIVLSLILFLLLIAGYRAGWIQPHGLSAGGNEETGQNYIVD